MAALPAPSLPHNLDAEQAILGALLADNRALQRFEHVGLDSDSFYDPVHGRLWSTITDMIKAGRLADGLTLHARLKDDGGLNDIGGAGYLATLIDAAADAAATPDYAALIMDTATRRNLIRLSDDWRTQALAAEEPGADLVERAAREMAALQTGVSHEATTALGAIQEALAASREASRRGVPPGFPTGWATFDQFNLRIERGKIYVVAGRASMGKSAVALAMAMGVATDPDVPRRVGVGILTIEMQAAEHGVRLATQLAWKSGCGTIAYEDVLAGKANGTDMAALERFSALAEKMPILFDDRGSVPFNAIAGRIRSLSRQMKDRHGCDMGVLVIDHLGLVQSPKLGGGMNRTNEVSYMTAELKRLARDMNIAIIEVCQISRGVEGRENKRPTLADLRESGSIEQDADVVLLVYRDSYYLAQQIHAMKQTGKAESDECLALIERLKRNREEVEINVAKRRGGRTGVLTLRFLLEASVIADKPERDDADPQAGLWGE